jgi:hypothetical protein
MVPPLPTAKTSEPELPQTAKIPFDASLATALQATPS